MKKVLFWKFRDLLFWNSKVRPFLKSRIGSVKKFDNRSVKIRKYRDFVEINVEGSIKGLIKAPTFFNFVYCISSVVTIFVCCGATPFPDVS